MSIARFAEQTWPDLLSQADEKYTPSRTDLFPSVVVMKLTHKQIEKARRGIHPKPFGKEATTIVNNNIRTHLNENNENINDATAPAVVTTSVHNMDDIPDDPIPMTSDNDALDIDSDDSDLPDLSNPKKKEKKHESKIKKSDKNTSSDSDRGYKKYKDDKKSSKMKYDESGKSEKKSNEMNKSEKSEKKSHESNSSKHGEKHSDRNKYSEKDRMKNRKSSSDKRESDKDKKEKYKNISTSSSTSKSSSSSNIDKSETEFKKSDKSDNSNGSKINSFSSNSSKSSASNSAENSETESIGSKDNSNSVPANKPKDLLGFLEKTREVAKKKMESKEVISSNLLAKARQLKKQKSEIHEKTTETNIKKFATPIIKTEPKDTNDPDDNMDFQTPLSGSASGSTALSALPDDGDYQAEIDSDQETVAFGGTPEKLDDEFNMMMENRNSLKKDKIGSKERSDNNDKNKRKRESSGSGNESKRQKGDDNDKFENSKKTQEITTRILPPFAAIPTREAENPPSVSSISSISQPATPDSESPLTPLSEKQLREEKRINMKKIVSLIKESKMKESKIRDLQSEYEKINSKIIDCESKTNEINAEEEKNKARESWLESQLETDEIVDDEEQFDQLQQNLDDLLETINANKKEKSNLEEERQKFVSKLNEIKISLQAERAALEADEKQIARLRDNIKSRNNTSGESAPNSPRPQAAQKNNNQTGLSLQASANVSAKDTLSSSVRNEAAVPSVPNSPASEILHNPPNPPSKEDTVHDEAVLSKDQPKCFHCGKLGIFECCNDTIYCSEDCQEADYDRHQDECKNVPEED